MTKRRVPPIIYDPQYLIVTRNANQAIVTAVWTKPLYDNLVASNGMVYDNTLNQVVIPETALYQITFAPRFAGSAVNSVMGARVLVNGVISKSLLLTNLLLANTDGMIPLSYMYYYSAGDILTTECFQNTGANRNLNVVNDLRTFWSIIRVSNP